MFFFLFAFDLLIDLPIKPILEKLTEALSKQNIFQNTIQIPTLSLTRVDSSAAHFSCNANISEHFLWLAEVSLLIIDCLKVCNVSVTFQDLHFESESQEWYRCRTFLKDEIDSQARDPWQTALSYFSASK